MKSNMQASQTGKNREYFFHFFFFAFIRTNKYIAVFTVYYIMKKTARLFDDRNEQKKRLEFQTISKKDAKVGEIWRYREGINLGNEISKGGKFLRPCLIIQNNLAHGVYLIVPLNSSLYAIKNKTSVEIRNFTKYNLQKRSWVVCNQTKCIDGKRLSNKLSSQKITGFLFSIICTTMISMIKKYPD